jgi:hypothetical protein
MTIIIIDIDGVVNPINARYTNLPGFFEHEDERFRAFLNPEVHGSWITELSKDACFIWGSAWEEHSNAILRMLKIDQEWDWIPMDYEDVGLGTWKIKAIRRWVEQNAPDEKIVWIDDELEQDAFKWAEERGNMLAIAPNSHTGLTAEELEQVVSFVRDA